MEPNILRPNINWITGEWYLSVRCQACDNEFAFMRDGEIDVITMEPLHVGGLLGAKKIADLVDAHNGVICPHSAQGPVCTLVGLQIAACTPNHYIQEYFDQFNVGWEKDLLTWTPHLKDGYLPIPSGPGLGADLNMDVVLAHPAHEHPDFNMWQEGWHFRREGE